MYPNSIYLSNKNHDQEKWSPKGVFSPFCFTEKNQVLKVLISEAFKI